MPTRRALPLLALGLTACSAEPLTLSNAAAGGPGLRRASMVLPPTECVRHFEVGEADRPGRLPAARLALGRCLTRG